jgi:hypothetical protein
MIDGLSIPSGTMQKFALETVKPLNLWPLPPTEIRNYVSAGMIKLGHGDGKILLQSASSID